MNIYHEFVMFLLVRTTSVWQHLFGTESHLPGTIKHLIMQFTCHLSSMGTSNRKLYYKKKQIP